MKSLPRPTETFSMLLLLALPASSLACGDGQTSIQPLPTLGGTLTRITSLSAGGQLTGYSQTSDNASHAFLYAAGTMVDLNAAGSDFSQGISVNSAGQVAGDTATGVFETHAFLYDGTSLNDLGTLGGSFSMAIAINEVGHVTGNSLLGDGFSFMAFLYDGGSLTALGTLGGSSSFANDLNQSGHIVGIATIDFDFESHAFLYTNGAMLDLGTLGGAYSTAYAVNDQDVVVGESELANFDTHAFSYANGVMTDLGTLGGSYSSASAVNAGGQVIGVATTAGDQATHGFIYVAGVMTGLGTLGGDYSEPLALDNLGRVVGVATSVNGTAHAFLWQNGTMVDLNSLLPANSGWELLSADFINDSGRIAGYGLLNGIERAYVLDLGSGNNPPVAVAGNDQSVECGVPASLDASASTDPDADVLSYEWSENGVVLGTNVTVAVTLSTGTHTIVLKVSDPCGLTGEDTVSVVVTDTIAPTITCPPAATVAVTGECQAAAPDFASQAVVADDCAPNAALAVSQVPAAGSALGLGEHTIVITVADASGNSAVCSTTVTVTDATAPVITSSPTILSVPAGPTCQGAVPDLTSSVVAADNCTPADQLLVVQNPPTGTMLAKGSHSVIVTVSDASGNSAMAAVSLVVADTTAPNITSVSASPSVLSPPNGKRVPVSISVVATDACDSVLVSQIISVTCNEPTAPDDIQVTGALTVGLAAVKGANGSPRVYTIEVQCVDGSGNAATGFVTVTVPKNSGGGGKKP